MKGSHVFRHKIPMVSVALVANRSHGIASVNLVAGQQCGTIIAHKILLQCGTMSAKARSDSLMRLKTFQVKYTKGDSYDNGISRYS